MFPTGIKDIDEKILLYLDDIDISSVFMTNKDTKIISNNETFWLNRILDKFPYLNLEILNKYKKTTWAKYYKNDLAQIDVSDPNALLLEASRNGRLDIVMIAIHNGAQLEYQERGITPLGEAVNHDKYNIVKYLLNLGSNVQTGTDYPLRVASARGNSKMVRILLNAGADVHALNEESLINAIYAHSPSTVKELIAAGANVHINNEEPLIRASKTGDLMLVKEIVNDKTNIHVNNNEAIRQAGTVDVYKFLKNYKN
jgi:ankyrin repeat protein